MKLGLHVLAIVLAITALVATAADEQRLTVYTPQTSYSVAVTEHQGSAYVSLLDVLTRLGSARARTDGSKWKLRFNDTDSEFKRGKNKAKVNHKDVRMPAPFLLEDGRGLVPVQALGPVLSRLIPGRLEFREAARRVFIGGAATQFSAELVKGNPSKLVLHFSAPVNPTISTEPGRVHMKFTHEPLISAVPARSFDDPLIKAMNFSERDGMAELTVHGGAPLLATFGPEQRTITIGPAPANPHAPPVAAAPAPGPAPGPHPTAPAETSIAAPRPRPAVVIDPGHGGEDRGASLSPTLAEKDVTLAWAQRLRAALEQRGIAATLLRNGDTSLTLDQRAELANAARPRLFITLHAGSTGTGVRIYTAHLGESVPRAASFLPWNTAQAGFLDGSRAVAGSILAEMRKREIPAGTAPVFLRPLNSVAAPALAIEVMPPGRDVGGLMSAGYQQSVCAAVADGIAAVTRTVGAVR